MGVLYQNGEKIAIANVAFSCFLRYNSEKHRKVGTIMEEQAIQQAQERKPRKQKKTQMEIIKEAYLPYAFLLLAAILIIIFIVGALVRGNADTAQEALRSTPNLLMQ